MFTAGIKMLLFVMISRYPAPCYKITQHK